MLVAAVLIVGSVALIITAQQLRARVAPALSAAMEPADWTRNPKYSRIECRTGMLVDGCAKGATSASAWGNAPGSQFLLTS